MRTSGEVAVCFWKKEWDGLTKNGGSGTMRVNEGGFGLVPYLCKGIVTRSCGCLLPKKCLHLTYVKGLLPAEKGAPGTTGTLHLTYVEGLLQFNFNYKRRFPTLAPYLCRGIVTWSL